MSPGSPAINRSRGSAVVLALAALLTLVSAGQALARPGLSVQRRGFTPKELGGLKFWVAADAVTGVSNGGNVSTWKDLSGNGLDLSQAAGTAQPTLQTNVLNGKPTVRFNGTTQFMGTAGNLDLTSGYSVFVVYKNRVRRDYNGIFAVAASTGAAHQLSYYWQAGTTDGGSGNLILSPNNSAGWWVYNDAPPAVNTFLLDSIVAGPSGAAIFKNGVRRDILRNGNPALPAATNPLFVGILPAWMGLLDGDVAELAIYNRALSPVERQKVDCYLASKYGFSIPGCAAFQPTSINGLKLWLDASQIPDITTGSSVASWPDLSPAGNSVTQSSSTLQPIYNAAVLNGRGVVRFDGTNDYLATTGNIDLTAGYTVFAVMKNRVRKNYNGIFTLSSGLANMGVFEYYWQQGTTDTASGHVLYTTNAPTVPGYIAFTDASPAINTYFLETTTHDGSTQAARKNGVTRSTGLATSPPFSAPATAQKGFIGVLTFHGGYLDGDIAELVIYDHALTAGQILQVEAYLDAKYALY